MYICIYIYQFINWTLHNFTERFWSWTWSCFSCVCLHMNIHEMIISFFLVPEWISLLFTFFFVFNDEWICIWKLDSLIVKQHTSSLYELRSCIFIGDLSAERLLFLMGWTVIKSWVYNYWRPLLFKHIWKMRKKISRDRWFLLNDMIVYLEFTSINNLFISLCFFFFFSNFT